MESVLLSPRRMTQYGTGRSYELGEVLLSGGRRITMLPDFSQAFEAGEATLDAIELALHGRTLAEVSTLVVFLHRDFLSVIEPLVKGVPASKLHWVSCHHTFSARNRIRAAGHKEPNILVTRQCASDSDAGILAWNILHRGKLEFLKPLSHRSEGEPIAPEYTVARR